MPDPNAVYKEAFRELQARLGRLPTAAEILPLNIAYAKSWAPAEETVLPNHAAAGRPVPAGFSRQPAPQAGAIGADTRTREGGAVAGEPLSGPGIIPEPEQAESEPERPSVNCGLPDGLILGRRGPAGGIVATCVTCSAPFERPNAKGRPPVRCEGCR